MRNDTNKLPARFDYDLSDTAEVTRRIRLAARQAMIDHKLNGNPIVEMIDGNIVWTQAEDIVIPDLDEINETARKQRELRDSRE